MEQVLKITNVLSDPTRYHIYQYVAKKHRDVTVQEIADAFHIHPNVARLHLSKLEDIRLLVSETQKTGKGGRPSRLYRLSDEVIQLNFPFRDYQLLAKISIQTMMKLGEAGKEALFETGHQFGKEMVEQQLAASNITSATLTVEQKLHILEDASHLLGLSPEFHYNADEEKVYFQIFNCPFKELTQLEADVCSMHNQFIKGMFDSLFTGVELQEHQNMTKGCDCCSYSATHVLV